VTGSIGRALAGALRRMALPLAAYYGIALAIPLANGAAQRGAAFWQHAFVVVVLPPAWIALVYTLCATVRALATARVTARTWSSPLSGDRRESRAPGCR
jgi:hypothetical protein